MEYDPIGTPVPKWSLSSYQYTCTQHVIYLLSANSLPSSLRQLTIICVELSAQANEPHNASSVLQFQEEPDLTACNYFKD